MPALTKVNNKKNKKKEEKTVGVSITLLSAGIAFMLGCIVILCFWQFMYKDIFYTQVVNENKDVGTSVYVATRDIAYGESIYDAVEEKVVPSFLVVSTGVSGDLSELKASSNIVANSIITSTNTYNPRLEDVVIDTSRQVVIDFLETPGIEEGDYIDIRLKVFNGDDSNTYDDKIVASKKCVLSKTDEKTIQLMLSESEILNMNSAVVEAANGNSTKSDGRTAVLYVTKYIDPANQPKAMITYTGKGIPYTDSEIAESQQRLRDLINGNGEYASPTIEEKAHDNSFGVSENNNSQDPSNQTENGLSGSDDFIDGGGA